LYFDQYFCSFSKIEALWFICVGATLKVEFKNNFWIKDVGRCQKREKVDVGKNF